MFNRFIALDFETANHNRNSACAVGISLVEDREIINQAYFLIKPPTPHFVFTYIHGITWEDVRNEPSFGELWPVIKPFFRKIDFVAAHNAHFDRSVLVACCELNGIVAPRKEYRCTLQLAKKMLKLESNSLDMVSNHFGIELDHHNAASDAEACARIMIELTANAAKKSSISL